MKKIYLFFALTLVLSCCNKKDDEPALPAVAQLPPATQTGANTFGCLLDGQVFKPGTSVTNPIDCTYQFVGGSYYLTLQATRRYVNDNIVLIGCGTEKLQIAEGQTYQLFERLDGNAYGKFFFNVSFNYTSIIQTGQLKITFHDPVNQILSGTFWYDILDAQGNLHQIREGRFDMRYSA